ncbi:hypothetical protein A2210_03420 [Candidatus Woesebacteria bacterium RIFOXYA1_FULL_40_18]|uniref:Metallo-beta-lactamase domain-containing protein 1 n=4 Tax=Candidatus Woeseibacteriota TaxID=1752722 RepID=A0A0G0SEZ8_9BACT|nr:MAG: hypothetical protein UU03_C0006G0003 [Candidatus Woesebacteria bacterium GW2011_GWA1_40_45]OGM76936.1 MAG: hypothetical protein A2210_03420 [Candidatus Woesebacteria bacterium RIFOXYA1_FULL_40_18]OGM81125.1 MAG: hypothetical protein A2361_01350 [Candidatus Woesebacteria bacterium RIFOXYB1_FULL_40_26]OGM88087.1 MAG: hypothetical protein A2614_00485 [Candidatus Woesebacteria bacterium RIFOXYD1_FULL_40_21]
MNKVKVLVEGYAKVNSDGTWDATCSTTLIDTGKLKIIVDPGCDRELLLEALEKEGLKTTDIDYVFISHYHPDHCLLMGIFENATVFDSIQWQKGPVGGETPEVLPETDIRLIKTPGHTLDHTSLLVNTDKGKILVGADVFWWAENEEQKVDIEKHDDFAEDMKTLKESRRKALEIADFIIPGHGKMFKVKT